MAHPATLSGFQRAVAELFQANPEVTLEETREPDGLEIYVLASVESYGICRRFVDFVEKSEEIEVKVDWK